jgi:hypothetical protein
LMNLNISKNIVRVLPTNVFAPLIRLRTLDLSNNALTVLPDGIFDGLGSLTTLDMSNNNLHTWKMQYSQVLLALQSIDLVGNSRLYSNLSMEVLERLSLLPTFKLCFQNSYLNPLNRVCTTCPAFAHARNTGLQLSDCICTPGYEKTNAGECRACTMGFYSTGNRSVCKQCAQGSYQNQTNSSACTLCPALHSSPKGSFFFMNCACAHGYAFNSIIGLCQACDAGTYKNVVSNTQGCIPCPSYSGSASNATVREFCVCNPGYTNKRDIGDFVVCNACVPGTYKATIGSMECQECAANTFKSNAGPGNCTKCTDLSSSFLGSVQQSDCKCNSGSSMLDNATCALCIPGKMASTNANGSNICMDCVAGNWKSNYGPGNCSACSINSICDAGAVHVGACVCVGGYSRNNQNLCIPCDEGFFSNFVGLFRTTQPQLRCEICPQNTYAALPGQDNCTDCPTFTTTNGLAGAKTIQSCVCSAGNTLVNGQCVQCSSGKFKALPGDAVCYSCYYDNSVPSIDRTTCVCDSGYYGHDMCTKCPGPNTVSVTGSTILDDCKCDAGYSQTVSNGVNVCEHCAAGSYKMTASSYPCSPCEAGKFKSFTGRGHCTACLPGKFSVKVGASLSTVCTSCESGSYSTSLSENACVQCPQSYSSVDLTNAFRASIMSLSCVDFIMTSSVV